MQKLLKKKISNQVIKRDKSEFINTIVSSKKSKKLQQHQKEQKTEEKKKAQAQIQWQNTKSLTVSTQAFLG